MSNNIQWATSRGVISARRGSARQPQLLSSLQTITVCKPGMATWQTWVKDAFYVRVTMDRTCLMLAGPTLGPHAGPMPSPGKLHNFGPCQLIHPPPPHRLQLQPGPAYANAPA